MSRPLNGSSIDADHCSACRFFAAKHEEILAKEADLDKRLAKMLDRIRAPVPRKRAIVLHQSRGT